MKVSPFLFKVTGKKGSLVMEDCPKSACEGPEWPQSLSVSDSCERLCSCIHAYQPSGILSRGIFSLHTEFGASIRFLFKNRHFPFLIVLFHILSHQRRSPWNKSIDNTYGTLLHFTCRKTTPYPMKNFFLQAYMRPAGLFECDHIGSEHSQTQRRPDAGDIDQGSKADRRHGRPGG